MAGQTTFEALNPQIAVGQFVWLLASLPIRLASKMKGPECQPEIPLGLLRLTLGVPSSRSPRVPGCPRGTKLTRAEGQLPT